MLRIFRGLPSREAFAAVERGEGVLGGCVLFAGSPDWQCAKCRHEWFDAEDPVRRRLDACIAQSLDRRGPWPPIPELSPRGDGLRERAWTVRMERLAQVSPALPAKLRERALSEYRRSLAEKDARGDLVSDVSLDVAIERERPRTYVLRIARGGAVPDWDTAADTWVMSALEAIAGPIHAWQGISRPSWKSWPLPPPSAPARGRGSRK